MNIFWLLTDSISSYERNDKFGLLEIYKKLKDNKEGFLFSNAISLFPSTAFSVLSMITGRFPYYLAPDFLDNPPEELRKELIKMTYFKVLQEHGFNIYSFICYDIGNKWFKDITNPIIPKERYKNGYQLNGFELNEEFMNYIENVDLDKNNVFFIHYRVGDEKMNEVLDKIVKFFKREKLWRDNIFLINSDHGYRRFRESLNPLHFDDIHIKSIRPAVFLRLSKEITNSKPKEIKKRIYLIDLWETILDYLKIRPVYEREAVSFKEIIENNKDISKNRIVRGDAYLMFQPIRKTYIIKDNYKLNIINSKIELKIIDEIKEKKINNEEVKKELLNFYKKTEEKAKELILKQLEILFKNSEISKIKNKKILIPKSQFPSLLVEFLIKKLNKKNKVFFSIPRNEIFDYVILIFNRLTGYGIKKLKKEIESKNNKVKKYIYLTTTLQLTNQREGYWSYLINNIKSKRGLLLIRPAGTLIWLFYYPLYLNKNIKDRLNNNG